MKELVQSDILCDLGGTVLFRLEPAFFGLEQCVHLALSCKVGLTVELQPPTDRGRSHTRPESLFFRTKKS